MKNDILSKFFVLVQEKLPEGSNPDMAFPVWIGNSVLYVVIFEPEIDHIRFGLFLFGQKYSRKTLEIKKDGSVNEDTVGVIPPTDLSNKEPDFTGISNEEIAILIASETNKILNNQKMYVNISKPCDLFAMNSMGNASKMLIKQFEFPFVYEAKKDDIICAYLDRIQEWRKKECIDCLEKYGLSETNFHHKVQEIEDNVLLDFLCEIILVKRSKYTGYRILGTVGGNGHNYYCLELFSKHPDTNTVVFSGNDAPNVFRESK